MNLELLLIFLYKRFKPYFGEIEDQLAAEFNISVSKDKCARITKHILGMKTRKLKSLKRLVPKTMANQMTCKLVLITAEEPFEESDLYHDLL